MQKILQTRIMTQVMSQKKDEYKIYCTYKLVHAWYDAIEVGVKAAVEDFAV